MSSQTTGSEPKPLREKLLPQASLRFFLLLIGLSAGVMVVFRLALLQDSYWARIVAVMFAITGACFIGYAVIFFLANLFSLSTRPLRSAIESQSDPQESSQEAS